ncbi:hypothetical protein XENTR_v10005952 [Xenopus tropicalis]|nr:hypothetical protein XENTR_v10005952 [Xenopus tropicalis]
MYFQDKEIRKNCNVAFHSVHWLTRRLLAVVQAAIQCIEMQFHRGLKTTDHWLNQITYSVYIMSCMYAYQPKCTCHVTFLRGRRCFS